MEITTFKKYCSITRIRTSIRNQLCDSRPWIVPKVNVILRILLIIERNCKWNRFFNNIREWWNTNHIVWINVGSNNWLGTKSTSSILIEIKEIFSPYLDYCLSIFRSISWVNSVDSCGRIVSIGYWIGNIWKITAYTDCKCNNFCFCGCRSVITL